MEGKGERLLMFALAEAALFASVIVVFFPARAWAHQPKNADNPWAQALMGIVG